MRKRMLIIATGVAIAGAGTIGGMAIAGGGSEREVARTVVGQPVTATERGPAVRAGKKSTIVTYYSTQATVPAEGSGLVQGIKCPKKAGDAVGGGAATSQGIVVSYLSSHRPDTGGFKPNIYWVGVDDNSSTNQAGSGAIVEIQCSKAISVR